MSEQPDQEEGVIRRYLSALAYRDFRILWIANLSSQAAAWALIVARGWFVYAMSDSSGWVGLVTFAAMIPRVVVTPISGYLSDRFDRRTVLASMFALNLVQNTVLAMLAFAGTMEIWHLVVLSFINGSARAAQMPAGQALLPEPGAAPSAAERGGPESGHTTGRPSGGTGRHRAPLGMGRS